MALVAPDLEGVVGEGLNRRLLSDSPRPIAVALSGGGDSLALLLIAAEWSRLIGRRLVVLTVDHQLRPLSADWTNTCASIAHRLGLPFRALAWTGDKPATGLPAAARAARHALLAEAASEFGARVILMGHTADDALEAALMRAQGSSTPEPWEWAPSPSWPEGRGVFLLRPMLGVRRADLREWLRARGERWIDDPANDDEGYARPRARRVIARGALTSATSPRASAKAFALAVRPDASGGFEIDRSELRNTAPDALRRFVSAACVCAAGARRPPARDRVERLAERLTAITPFVATLAGARIEADTTHACFLREAGEVARGGLAPLSLLAGETGVWDGRFEITAERMMEVRARPGATKPGTVRDDGSFEAIGATSLTYDRLLAACGAIEREPT